MGLSRSFQITSIFHRLSVFENLRCALLWSMGYRYSFWTPLWLQRELTERTDAMLEDLNLAARRRHRGRAVVLCRPARAGNRHDHRRRRFGDPARRADRGHEQYRDRQCGRADPPGFEGQDAADGRARHEGGVRPRRYHHGAGLWPGDRLGAAAKSCAPTRRCRKPISGHWTPHDPRSQRSPRLLRPEPHPAWRGDGRERRRDRQPARAQRRRPIDRLQVDHGAGDGAGHREISRQGHRGLAARSGRPLRHRLCAGRPADVSDPDGAAKSRTRPQALRQIRPLEFRRRVRAVSQSEGAAGHLGRRAVRRRAADADDVPHLDGRSRT